MTDLQYDTVVQDLLGVTTLTTMGGIKPSQLLAADSDGSLTNIGWTGYLTAAQTIAKEVMANATSKAKFISCDPSAGTCLADTIKAFGRKAFRRVLTSKEVTSFQRLSSVTPAGTAAEIAEATLYAFLASPSFIMLPELGTDKDSATGALKLTSAEVATRLSFLLWNSVPDDMLNTAADGNLLTTKEQISAQALRMLKSDRAKGMVASFDTYYLGIGVGSHWVNGKDHDMTKFPAYTANSYAPLMAEVDSFFQDLVMNSGTFKDIFLSPAAFVTKDTAPIYGVTSTATTPTKVMLDATKRPGFLTRAAFLGTFSHFDYTSPVLRGAFISGRVLGINPGTPDPKATMTPLPKGFTTNREAYEALTSGSPCSDCHGTFINPPGFVLEHYDAVGGWQDKDPLGGAINTTAPVIFNKTDTKTISTALDMMTEIASLPEAQYQYAQQWVAYAANRVANQNDACTVESLSGKLAGGTYAVASMMADYTQADSFRLRTVGN